MESETSVEWFDAMKDELKSIETNGVWELVELLEGCKTVGCKWLFVTKRDAKGKITQHKCRLIANGFTQKDGINYNKTFSPFLKKDSLKIVMSLVAHYDLELYQMDVKTTFLNGDLEEEIYID